jgi:putative phosphoribosyl transferase
MDAMNDAVAVQISAERALIKGDLIVREAAAGLVVLADGSGSARLSARTRAVAQALHREGYATLLLDLLTREEDAIDMRTAEYRLDVSRLGRRVVAALDWSATDPPLVGLPIACFATSAGVAAALLAAAERPELVSAIIARGGRPDLAGSALPKVQAPTLLIVGGHDQRAIELSRAAMRRMRAPVHLEIVPGASHFFDEPGAPALVSQLTLGWCWQHLARLRT